MRPPTPVRPVPAWRLPLLVALLMAAVVAVLVDAQRPAPAEAAPAEAVRRVPPGAPPPAAAVAPVIAPVTELPGEAEAPVRDLFRPLHRAVAPPPEPEAETVPRIVGQAPSGGGPVWVLEVAGEAGLARPGLVLQGWRVDRVRRDGLVVTELASGRALQVTRPDPGQPPIHGLRPRDE